VGTLMTRIPKELSDTLERLGLHELSASLPAPYCSPTKSENVALPGFLFDGLALKLLDQIEKPLK
jgi:hypothetical protein